MTVKNTIETIKIYLIIFSIIVFSFLLIYGDVIHQLIGDDKREENALNILDERTRILKDYVSTCIQSHNETKEFKMGSIQVDITGSAIVSVKANEFIVDFSKVDFKQLNDLNLHDCKIQGGQNCEYTAEGGKLRCVNQIIPNFTCERDIFQNRTEEVCDVEALVKKKEITPIDIYTIYMS